MVEPTIQVNHLKFQVNYPKIQEVTKVPNGGLDDPSELPGDPSELSEDTRGYRSSQWMAPRYWWMTQRYKRVIPRYKRIPNLASGGLDDPSELPGVPSELLQDTRGYIHDPRG